MSDYRFVYDDLVITEHGQSIAFCETPELAVGIAKKLNAFDDLLAACTAANKFLARLAETGSPPSIDAWCETQQDLSAAIGIATGDDVQKLLAEFPSGKTVKVDGDTFEIHERKVSGGKLYVRGANTMWYATGCLNA